MANVEILAPFILSFEGGFSDHPLDRGGATNMGVTMSTWKEVGEDLNGDGFVDVVDLKQLTQQDVIDRVLKPHYWDRVKGDQIKDQSIANLIVDWVWASGVWAIKHTQRALGVVQDGIVGPQTLTKLNSAEPQALFSLLHAERVAFIDRIIKSNPSQEVFRKGWLRRINAIKYGRLICNGDE